MPSIIGYDRGKEWDKKGLIGSVELGIFDECGDLRSIGRVSSLSLQKRIEMTEVVEGIPTLKKEHLGTVVECRFQELNKNLRGRHLQILSFQGRSKRKTNLRVLLESFKGEGEIDPCRDPNS